MRALLAAAAASLALAAAPPPVPDAPVKAQDLRNHIDILASDRFEGRAPATAGERLTTDYIVAELAGRGVAPGAADGSWLQPVDLVERRPRAQRAQWRAGGRTLRSEAGAITLLGSEAGQRLADAPVVFVGHGLVNPGRGIDQLAGADLHGAVALVLIEAPDVPGFPRYHDRVRTLVEGGAAAVIGIVSDDVPFAAIVDFARAGETRLGIDQTPAISGTMPASEAARLVRAAGGDFGALLNERPGPSFRAVPLALTATLEVQSDVRRTVSNNVVGRIRGTRGGGESVLLLAHWDHLGLCRPEGAADRICNGAVDNASGVATLIEIAGRLARQRPERDVLVLATTAEEAGLLGAEHFAARPPVPIGSIVAALNFDTVAVHAPGGPLAVIGRGTPPLDEAIAATAASLGRSLDTSGVADAFVERQDGWALARAGVPAAMVGGSFADMAALQAFLAGNYHGPGDEARADLPLEGAAEDATFLVALVRRLADPSLYSPPGR